MENIRLFFQKQISIIKKYQVEQKNFINILYKFSYKYPSCCWIIFFFFFFVLFYIKPKALFMLYLFTAMYVHFASHYWCLICACWRKFMARSKHVYINWMHENNHDSKFQNIFLVISFIFTFLVCTEMRNRKVLISQKNRKS